jgi:hypothetical protein
MVDLRFIPDDELRTLIERDRRELQVCLEHDLYKSAMLLSGSIIEALLVNCFLVFQRLNTSEQDVLKADLAHLIDWAESDGLITPQTARLSTVVRNYRNLIHPGREYRLKEKVNIHAATVAFHLVDLVIEEVSEKYATKLGYTAEQVINKVKMDPSCVSLFRHLLSKMVVAEKIKAYRAIPNECRSDNLLDGVVDSLLQLRTIIRNDIPDQKVRDGALWAFQQVQGGSRDDGLYALRFYAEELDLLDSDQREAVISYVIGILNDGTQDEIMRCLEWEIFHSIGKQFDSDEGLDRLYDVVAERFLPYEDLPPDSLFIDAVACIVSGLSYARVKEFRNRISRDQAADQWYEHEYHTLLDKTSYYEIPF